jgi:hypothetical protein
MKLVCTCGIGHYVYDWPASDVKHNGVKMKERRMQCSCSRGIIVRTALKDEPEVAQAKMVSFEALSKHLGVNSKPIEENQYKFDRNTPKSERNMEINLTKEDVKYIAKALVHYGDVFKPAPVDPTIPDQFIEERKAFNNLAQKFVASGQYILSLAESELVLSALTTRNINKMFMANPEDDEDINHINRKHGATLREIIERAYNNTYEE